MKEELGEGVKHCPWLQENLREVAVYDSSMLSKDLMQSSIPAAVKRRIHAAMTQPVNAFSAATLRAERLGMSEDIPGWVLCNWEKDLQKLSGVNDIMRP